MKTSPRASRPIAPVGQSIMQLGFLQCWQLFGTSSGAHSTSFARRATRATTSSPARGARRLALDDDLVAAADEARDAVVVGVGAAPGAVAAAHARVLIDDEERARDPHAIEIAEDVRRRLRAAGEELAAATPSRARGATPSSAAALRRATTTNDVARDRDEPRRPATRRRATRRAERSSSSSSPKRSPRAEVRLDARLAVVVALRLEEAVGDEERALGDVALAIDVLAARDLDVPHGVEEHLEVALGKRAREARGSQEVAASPRA